MTPACARKLPKSWNFSSTGQFLIPRLSIPSLTAPVFSNPPAWKRLIGPNLSVNERNNLITSIFSDRDEVEVFKYLSGNDAQDFVDVIDEASIRILLPLDNGLVESH